jgi:hypothetical protein
MQVAGCRGVAEHQLMHQLLMQALMHPCILAPYIVVMMC